MQLYLLPLNISNEEINNYIMLYTSTSNTKIGQIPSFSLVAGYSCPSANECLSKADLNTGKIVDGPNTKFRCFAASIEVLRPNVRRSHWNNFNALRKLKSINIMADLIQEDIVDNLPRKAKLFRIHVSGDFFNEKYFKAWMKVASENEDILFYAYTKSLDYWVNNINNVPNNLLLTASKGGRFDYLIPEYDLRHAEVVFSEEEAKLKGLPIDTDDSCAYNPNIKNFALMIHGVQPAGSEASLAVRRRARKN